MDTGKIDIAGLSESDALLAVSRSTVAMVLTDPGQPDNPIIYVNEAFERMTGYSADAVVGRNCRFLQGKDTSPHDVAALREALAEEREISLDLLNYRANGEAFTNRLIISPVRNEAGVLVHFLGIQKDLSARDANRPAAAADRSAMEIQHRVKNHLSMIIGLIRLQAREAQDPRSSETLARRIESMQLLYEELSRPEMSQQSTVGLEAYLSRICSAISHLDGRAGIRVNIDVDDIHVDTETALRLGLIASEVLTNCLQHAFGETGEGQVEISAVRRADGGLCLTVIDDGIGMPQGKTWPDSGSMGGRIVLGLVDGLGGELKLERPETGTRVSLDVPGVTGEGR